MKIFLCACLLVLVFQSYAQQMDERLFYLEKVEKYRRLKTAGVFLSVAGSIALVVVGVRLSEDDFYYYHSDEDDYAMALTAVAGVSALGAGIPLWIVGGYNQSKYNEKMKRVSIGMRIDSGSKGLSLTYRF